MKNRIYAVQLADNIAIKETKAFFKGKLLFSDSDELFFEKYKNQYIYIFKYGVMCFFNVDEDEIRRIKKQVLPYTNNPSTDILKEEVDIFFDTESNYINDDKIFLIKDNIESIRLVMLNVSQSVALNTYAIESEKILTDTKRHTIYLEKKGKLDISGNKLKRYIAKVLNVKNKISEYLYIFETHEIVSDDDQLNKFDIELKKHFDLKDRYRAIHEQLEIIKENLELFKDLMQHRNSSRLEWIIIILIFIEIADHFLLKFS